MSYYVAKIITRRKIANAGDLEERWTPPDRFQYERRQWAVVGHVWDLVLGRTYCRRFRKLHVFRQRKPDARSAVGRSEVFGTRVRGVFPTSLLSVLCVHRVFCHILRCCLSRFSQPPWVFENHRQRCFDARNPHRLLGEKNPNSLNSYCRNHRSKLQSSN